MSKYLMKSAAAIVLGLAATACSHDLDFVEKVEQQSIDNAQQTLGFYIPENQDWVMTTKVTANLPISGEAGKIYTVKVYSNEPLADGIGYVLTDEEVVGGQNFVSTFRMPSYKTNLVIGITDSEGKTNYKRGEVVNGQITSFTDINEARTRAIGDYARYKGTMQPTVNGVIYTFPSDCATSNFLAEVPDGVLSYTEVAGQNQTGYASGNSYLDPSWTQEVNIWGFYDGSKNVGGTLYIKGNNNFSNRSFTVCENTDVYLLEGSTLTLNDNAASTIKFNLYIAPTAKLIANGETGRVKLDNGAKLYNHGEIECKSFEVNNTSMFYNGSVGKLTTTGEVYVANSNSVIVNDGEITSGTSTSKTGKLVTAGSGRVQNNAEWTVYGETIINSNDNIWVNNGRFTTENYTYTATSSSVINNCFLTVNNNFCINIADGSGDFKIDSGGGVLTKNFYGGGTFTAKDNNNNDVTYNGGPFKVTMGSGTVFKVTETAYMNALGSGIATAHYGFDGVGTNGYAVLQAKKIVRESLGEGNVAYSGNLYVSAEEHFAQGYSGQYPFIHYYNGCTENNIYAPGFKGGSPAIQIEETPCNPGFGGNNPPDEYETYTYAFEDNRKTCDFDLNDVVLQVKYKEGSNKTKLEIKLVAAGCEYDNYVYLGSTRIEWANGAEVHDALGVKKGQMVNTGGGKSIAAQAVTKEIDTPAGFDFQEADFKIKPYKKNADPSVDDPLETDDGFIGIIEEGNPSGLPKAPVGIVIPDKWKWPIERTNVTNAYPEFVAWGKQENVNLRKAKSDWYKSHVSGTVVE